MEHGNIDETFSWINSLFSLALLSYGLDFLFNFLHLGELTWDWQKELGRAKE